MNESMIVFIVKTPNFTVTPFTELTYWNKDFGRVNTEHGRLQQLS